MMDDEIFSGFYPMLLAGYIALFAGCLVLLGLVLFTLSDHFFKGSLLLSLSLLFFGTGELFNHPKQKLITKKTVQLTKNREYHRTRNSCGLGNLLDICALLFFFMSMASFFFPY